MTTTDLPDYICLQCNYRGSEINNEDICVVCGHLYIPNEDGNGETCPKCHSPEYANRCPECGVDEFGGFTHTDFLTEEATQHLFKGFQP